MPRSKHAGNRVLTTLANQMLGTEFSELHTGYRACSRDLLLHVPWLRNALDPSFDSELLFQAVHFGFRIEEVPTSTIYDEDDSNVSLCQAVVYGARTLTAAGKLVAHRNSWWRSRRYLP
jgi:hypothetical protein